MLVRSLTFALLGTLLAGSPALATTRGEPSHAQRPAAGTPHQARSPVRPVPRAVLGAVHRAAPVRGQIGMTRDWRTATANTACVRSRGVTRCRGQAVTWLQEGSVGGWSRGLAPAANVQANECPAGTMATLAHGHGDVVRCMPI